MYLTQGNNPKNIIKNTIFLIISYLIISISGDMVLISGLVLFIPIIWSIGSLIRVLLFGYTESTKQANIPVFLNWNIYKESWAERNTPDEDDDIDEDESSSYSVMDAFKAGKGDGPTYEEMRQKRKRSASNRKISKPRENNESSNNSEVETKTIMTNEIKTYEIWVKIANGSGPKINQKVRIQATDNLAAVRQANATYGQENVTQLATEVRD
tara:strand:- start:98 stop:733 length:636 start_codon:yes stop_codon:yes gene_type:complete